MNKTNNMGMLKSSMQRHLLTIFRLFRNHLNGNHFYYSLAAFADIAKNVTKGSFSEQMLEFEHFFIEAQKVFAPNGR